MSSEGLSIFPIEQMNENSLRIFREATLDYLQDLNISDQVADLEIDHIGVRFKSSQDVDKIKESLASISKQGRPLSSAVVNGREINIFELIQELQFGSWQIPCIELPYPAPNHPYLQDGWEHVEFVLDSEAMTLEELQRDFQSRFPNVDIERLKASQQYSESLPKVEVKQIPNPTIALTKYPGLTVKFHPRSIQTIISSKGKDF